MSLLMDALKRAEENKRQNAPGDTGSLSLEARTDDASPLPDLSSHIAAVDADLQAVGPGASVVGIASIDAMVGSAVVPAYCASKSGLLGLTRSMAGTLGRLPTISPQSQLSSFKPMPKPTMRISRTCAGESRTYRGCGRRLTTGHSTTCRPLFANWSSKALARRMHARQTSLNRPDRVQTVDQAWSL